MILDIKRAAKLHGKTLKEIAPYVQSEREGTTGVTASALSQYQNGNPTLKVLQGVASAIGCNITDLFFAEDGEETPSAKVVCPHCGKALNIHID